MPKTVTRVLVLRHAETATPDRFHGVESDVGLSERGRLQAAEVARRLAAESPEVLVSSGMRRALDTAAPIASACGLTVEVEPLLHERKMGTLAGVTRDEGMPLYRETLRHWMAGDVDFTHEGGESFAAIRDRVVPVFERVVGRAAGKTLVVVAHGMVIRVLLSTLLDEPGLAGFDQIKIDNVAINDLRWDGEAWTAVVRNRTIGGDLDGFPW